MPTSNSTQKQKIQKAHKNKKSSFPKELVENADVYKPVLNKIMATHYSCVEYNTRF